MKVGEIRKEREVTVIYRGEQVMAEVMPDIEFEEDLIAEYKVHFKGPFQKQRYKVVETWTPIGAKEDVP